MGWEVVSDEELPDVLKALEENKCVSCYAEIVPDDGGFYCYECDPRERGTDEASRPT